MTLLAPSTRQTDETLMLRVRRDDDTEAFGQLYDRYAALAFRVARSVCHDVSAAEEIVQDGFLSVWRGRARYRPESGSVKAWTLSIVRHRAIDSVRRESRNRHAELDEHENPLPDAGAASTPDTVVARSEADTLRGFMSQLPAAQAEVITLAFFEGFTHSEIAERLALPPGTVKGRMRLGLHRLRSDMDEAAAQG